VEQGSTVTVAAYRGRHSGRIGPRLLAWWQRCDWSHLLIVWAINGDKALVSEATLWHGVHTSWRYWSPIAHDCWDVPADSEQVWTWWEDREGWRYDLLGLAGFVFRRIKGSLRAMWCSEAVMESLGYPDGWRFDVAVSVSVMRKHGAPRTFPVQHD
jgi:hypothetical protein